MDQISLQIDESYITRNFFLCAQCVGYCRDSGRQETADDVQSDLPGLVAVATKEGYLMRMLAHGIEQEDLWIVYHSALFIKKEEPRLAMSAFERIIATGFGMVVAVSLIEARTNKR